MIRLKLTIIWLKISGDVVIVEKATNIKLKSFLNVLIVSTVLFIVSKNKFESAKSWQFIIQI